MFTLAKVEHLQDQSSDPHQSGILEVSKLRKEVEMHETEDVKDHFAVFDSSDKLIQRQKSFIKRADYTCCAIVVIYSVCYYIVVN